jgi:hypothetical protein
MNLADLDFYKHSAGFQAKALFENGYGVSIVPESDGETYELAILRHYEGKKAHLTYDSGVTEDVIRYATVNAIDSLIERIKSLPNPLNS